MSSHSPLYLLERFDVGVVRLDLERHVLDRNAFASAVVDAFAHLGVVHMTMPHSAYRVWQQLKACGVNL